MQLRLDALFLFLATLTVLVAACDTRPDDDDTDRFDRSGMLENIATSIIVPSYAALQDAVDDLAAAATAFTANPSAASLAQAQQRLKAARLAWQDASLFEFGPAESVTLRASLNTYPADAGKIEQNVASGSYTLGTIANRGAEGFPALGYLLHGTGETDTEIAAAFMDPNRRAYLLDNVTFIAGAVDATVAGWAPADDNYLGAFLSPANAGTDMGSSLGMLINAFVMHYERFLRDGKIGIPAGVRSAGVPRPSSTEAFYGGYSVELALANLRAAKRLFLGNSPFGSDGLGLDDYLRALDAGALATEIETEFDEAIAALGALDDPLAEQIQQNNAPVLTAFQEIQNVTVLLKADMTSILGITITFDDNDGD